MCSGGGEVCLCGVLRGEKFVNEDGWGWVCGVVRGEGKRGWRRVRRGGGLRGKGGRIDV